MFPALSEHGRLRYGAFLALYVAQGLPEGLLYVAVPAWLAQNGVDPLQNEPEYTSIRVGDIIRKENHPINPFSKIDIYGATVEYFTQQRGYTEGKDFFVCPYDWRKDNRGNATGTLNNTLDKCINQALTQNPNATQVNILAHSMGGVIARYYISDPIRAQKIKRLITLGTPYLGAPKIALGILDQMCFIDDPICITNPEKGSSHR